MRMVCISLIASVVSVVVDMRGSEHLHMHMSLEHRRCLLGLATLSHHSAILFILGASEHVSGFFSVAMRVGFWPKTSPNS